MPKTQKTRSTTEEVNEINENIHTILQKSVQSGRVGNLKLDPQHLVFEPQVCKKLFIIQLLIDEKKRKLLSRISPVEKDSGRLLRR